jgi:toxin ParE1/3/4
LDKIFDYIARDNPAAADRVVRRVEEIAEAIGRNPHLGLKVSRSGVRVFPAHPYPYLIFYEVADTVRIIRIRHAARRRPFFHEEAREFTR